MKDTRGGISYVSTRYSKANNKYLKSCDPKQDSKHIFKLHIQIIYLEANSLYVNAVSKFLPASGFKWIDTKELDLNKYTILAIVQKDVFLELILNIQNSYKNYTMIFL